MKNLLKYFLCSLALSAILIPDALAKLKVTIPLVVPGDLGAGYSIPYCSKRIVFQEIETKRGGLWGIEELLNFKNDSGASAQNPFARFKDKLEVVRTQQDEGFSHVKFNGEYAPSDDCGNITDEFQLMWFAMLMGEENPRFEINYDYLRDLQGKTKYWYTEGDVSIKVIRNHEPLKSGRNDFVTIKVFSKSDKKLTLRIKVLLSTTPEVSNRKIVIDDVSMDFFYQNLEVDLELHPDSVREIKLAKDIPENISNEEGVVVIVDEIDIVSNGNELSLSSFPLYCWKEYGCE